MGPRWLNPGEVLTQAVGSSPLSVRQVSMLAMTSALFATVTPPRTAPRLTQFCLAVVGSSRYCRTKMFGLVPKQYPAPAIFKLG